MVGGEGGEEGEGIRRARGKSWAFLGKGVGEGGRGNTRALFL